MSRINTARPPSPILKARIASLRDAARKADEAWAQGLADASRADAITRDEDIAAVKREAAQRHEDDLTRWEINLRADMRAEVRRAHHITRLTRLRSTAMAAKRTYEAAVERVARELALAAVQQENGEGR